ncbi:MAG: protein phosphatase 2C domain-containing protein [Anaerolineae bacterium]|nr:protein phosphatase 2C domain-containing protein [Anaerolineae bacterium]
MGNAQKRPDQQQRVPRSMQWRILGESVRGASHVRSGLPNQDAIQWTPTSQLGPPLILSVSDGHGSPKSFRSDVGSRFAVDIATRLIQELLAGQPDPSNISAVKRMAEERLSQEMVRRWQRSVDEHLKANPFTEEELERLETKQGADARRSVEKSRRLAYGATILSVLVTQDFILYFQLGDGDILIVMDDEAVVRPLPHDERLFANQTTSLCTEDAWRDVRLRFQRLYGPNPALILVSSDGYANSFVNEEAFLKVGTDILDILREDGLKAVSGNLRSWLEEATRSGSGDDVTLGLIVRADVPRRTRRKTAPVVQAHEPLKDAEEVPHVQSHPEPATLAPVRPAVTPAAPDMPPTSTSPMPAASTPVPPALELEPATSKPADAAPVALPSVAVTPPSSAAAKAETSDVEEPEEVRPIVPPGKRRRRIKDVGGPIEPSKKLQTDLFFDD